MKRPAALRILIAVTILFGLGIFPVLFIAWPDHTDVRNLSGQTVTNVVFELRDYQTDWFVTRHIASLRPGGSIRIRHWHNDTKAVLQFGIAGRRFRHEEGYMDLWTGEGWRFDIQPDGTVESGYDYDERH
jgi:hypothetical protein